MIITCEKCSTNYKIEPTHLGSEGRKVKCIKCQHIWLAKLPVTASTQPELPKADLTFNEKLKQNFLPVVINRKVPLWLTLSSIILLLFSLGLGLFFYSKPIKNMLPMTTKIYDKCGIFDTAQVVLENITLHKFGTAEDYDILVKGQVINKSEQDRYMPNIRFNIINNKGKTVASYSIASDKSILSPAETFPINNKLTHLTQDIAYINIDIGNKVDFVLR